MHFYKIKGISFIEVLFVLLLMSFSFYFSINYFQAMTARHSLDHVTNSLTNILSYARNYAITSNQSISICPSIDGKNCINDQDIKISSNKYKWTLNWLVLINTENNLQNKNNVIYTVFNSSKKISIVFNKGNITFNNLGNSSKSGTFEIKNAMNSKFLYEVVISSQGRIRKEIKQEEKQ